MPGHEQRDDQLNHHGALELGWVLGQHGCGAGRRMGLRHRPPTVYAGNVTSHGVDWSQTLHYADSPAYSNGTLYAIGDGQLRALTPSTPRRAHRNGQTLAAAT